MLPAPAFPVPPLTNALPSPPLAAAAALSGAAAASAAASAARWLRDTLRMWSVIGSILPKAVIKNEDDRSIHGLLASVFN